MPESHAVLVVEFTGPSVSDGTLCTDRLAPSLLALSDALRFLNRLVNPDGVEAGLSVTKAEGGRFELGLLVWRTFENQIACLADCLVEILALKKWLEGGTDAAFAFNPAIGGGGSDGGRQASCRFGRRLDRLSRRRVRRGLLARGGLALDAGRRRRSVFLSKQGL